MSVSSVAPTPFYHDPERLQIGLPQPRAQDAESSSAEAKLSMFAEEDEPSFWDVLDVINPLQHIPIINDIYRDLTGDKIGVGARLVGGTLFGGAIGLAAATANCLIEESTGKDVGGHVMALFKDDSAPAGPAETQFASAPPPAPPAAVEPAKTVAADTADTAPVIELPDTAAAAAAPAPAGQPMMFTLDGAQPASAPAQPAQIVAQVTARPVGAPARYLPTPNRNLNSNPAPLPPVTVPVATGSSRSNTPITGRAPNAAMPNAAASAATSAAMQRALAGQQAGHPMAPPIDAANPSASQTAANPDWFSAAWGQALDKYQRANQINGKPPATISVE